VKWSGEKVWGEGSYIVRAPRKCTPVQNVLTFKPLYYTVYILASCTVKLYTIITIRRICKYFR
jgi:hypothetical protein